MLERSAPTNNHGLVLRPRLRDCIGKECPTVATDGRCFPSGHHLYWPKMVYAGTSALAFEFRSDRHNIVSMAHCRHNGTWKKALHTKYDLAPIPSDDVMTTFLDESATLSICGVTATNMARIVRQIKKAQKRQDTVKTSMQESFEYFKGRYTDLGKKVVSFEIMPADVVEEIIQPQLTTLMHILPGTDFGAIFTGCT